MIPSQITNLINAHIGLGRIQRFLRAPEMVPHAARKKLADAMGPFAGADALMGIGFEEVRKGSSRACLGVCVCMHARAGPLSSDSLLLLLLPLSLLHGQGAMAVRIYHGSFSWSITAEPLIRGINLNIEHGQLIMIVGEVSGEREWGT
jgi:hypothetical protein